MISEPLPRRHGRLFVVVLVCHRRNLCSIIVLFDDLGGILLVGWVFLLCVVFLFCFIIFVRACEAVSDSYRV
jgi:hypothetical protein